jgi:hypothetical protein
VILIERLLNTLQGLSLGEVSRDEEVKRKEKDQKTRQDVNLPRRIFTIYSFTFLVERPLAFCLVQSAAIQVK